MFLLELIRSFQDHRVQYALVGGYAVALHGAVRGTMDIDCIVSLRLENLKNTEKALKELGLVSRLPIEASDIYNFRKAYIEKRNLIAWHFHHPQKPQEQVDIVITHDLKKQKIDKMQLAEQKICLLEISELIKMKQKSNQAQDIEDVKALQQIKGERKK